MIPARPHATLHATLPERFNWLESMLFAPEPGRARELAERYVGEVLSRPAPPAPRRPRWSTLPMLPAGSLDLGAHRGAATR